MMITLRETHDSWVPTRPENRKISKVGANSSRGNVAWNEDSISQTMLPMKEKCSIVRTDGLIINVSFHYSFLFALEKSKINLQVMEILVLGVAHLPSLVSVLREGPLSNGIRLLGSQLKMEHELKRAGISFTTAARELPPLLKPTLVVAELASLLEFDRYVGTLSGITMPYLISLLKIDFAG